MHEVLAAVNPLDSYKPTLRFNPSRIDSAETMLAAVMNGRGNGNKDEVLSFKEIEMLFAES